MGNDPPLVLPNNIHVPKPQTPVTRPFRRSPLKVSSDPSSANSGWFRGGWNEPAPKPYVQKVYVPVPVAAPVVKQTTEPPKASKTSDAPKVAIPHEAASKESSGLSTVTL